MLKKKRLLYHEKSIIILQGNLMFLVDDFDLNHIIFLMIIFQIVATSQFLCFLTFFVTLIFLTNNDGIILPQYVVGNLYLNELANANKLVFPKFISGSLFLSHLTNAKEVILPQYIGGDLYLSDLTNIEKNLNYHKNIDGDLIFG
ncbi:MAG: hypothetical protein L6V91_00925 [Bacilli bacterium]|nr:MAG: hypothetical protein L6V91_00925 [Bacilli bacterium]